jgi:hypothetical protein
MERVFRACDNLGYDNRQCEIEDPEKIDETQEHRILCECILGCSLAEREFPVCLILIKDQNVPLDSRQLLTKSNSQQTHNSQWFPAYTTY